MEQNEDGSAFNILDEYSKLKIFEYLDYYTLKYCKLVCKEYVEILLFTKMHNLQIYILLIKFSWRNTIEQSRAIMSECRLVIKSTDCGFLSLRGLLPPIQIPSLRSIATTVYFDRNRVPLEKHFLNVNSKI